jgi:hypothetical protein
MFDYRLNERLKKLPFYGILGYYVFKVKRFPYYMDYEMFRMTKVYKQIAYMGMGIILIELVSNFIGVMRKLNNEKLLDNK